MNNTFKQPTPLNPWARVPDTVEEGIIEAIEEAEIELAFWQKMASFNPPGYVYCVGQVTYWTERIDFLVNSPDVSGGAL